MLPIARGSLGVSTLHLGYGAKGTRSRVAKARWVGVKRRKHWIINDQTLVMRGIQHRLIYRMHYTCVVKHRRHPDVVKCSNRLFKQGIKRIAMLKTQTIIRGETDAPFRFDRFNSIA